MKKFYAGIVLEDSELIESTSNRIELEYYKISRARKINSTKAKKVYGIEIVKKEYREKFVKIEHEKILDITKDKKSINNLIYKLKENLVTPIGLEDVVNEIIE